MLADRYWVSPYDAVHAATDKLYQLRLASSLGFEIPRTLVTSNPARALAFYDECGEAAIAKPLSQGILPLGKRMRLMLTHRVPSAALTEIDRVRYCPTVFQEYVPKQYELRITAIGRHLFACRIDSQASDVTSVDWRHYTVDIPYAPVRLPDAIEMLCRRLLRSLGLRFGALDIVVTPDNRYIFLEINPVGQWLWIEQKTGLPMTEALVGLLRRRDS